MTDFDLLWDAQSRIIDYITRELHNLLCGSWGSSDYPAWIQAALLLSESVVPCKYVAEEKLYKLAEKILKLARENNYGVELWQVDGEGNKVNVRFEDFKNQCHKIQEWLQENEESRKMIWEERIAARLHDVHEMYWWLIQHGVNAVTGDQFHRIMGLYKKQVRDGKPLTFEEKKFISSIGKPWYSWDESDKEYLKDKEYF